MRALIPRTLDQRGRVVVHREAAVQFLICVVSGGCGLINGGEVGVARRWPVRFAAGLGALAVLLSGCTEKQPASETLPSTSSTATSESEDALPPLGPADFPMPDEARTKDPAGAEAFIRYYFDLLNRSLTDMDVQYLRELAVDCEECERIAQETEADFQNGYHYRGGEITLSSDMSVALTGANQAESAFFADQAALTVVDESGQPVPDLTFPARPRVSSGTLTIWDPSASTWRMKVLTLG
jgi:hypothetical protein